MEFHLLVAIQSWKDYCLQLQCGKDPLKCRWDPWHVPDIPCKQPAFIRKLIQIHPAVSELKTSRHPHSNSNKFKFHKWFYKKCKSKIQLWPWLCRTESTTDNGKTNPRHYSWGYRRWGFGRVQLVVTAPTIPRMKTHANQLKANFDKHLNILAGKENESNSLSMHKNKVYTSIYKEIWLNCFWKFCQGA